MWLCTKCCLPTSLRSSSAKIEEVAGEEYVSCMWIKLDVVPFIGEVHGVVHVPCMVGWYLAARLMHHSVEVCEVNGHAPSLTSPLAGLYGPERFKLYLNAYGFVIYGRGTIYHPSLAYY